MCTREKPAALASSVIARADAVPAPRPRNWASVHEIARPRDRSRTNPPGRPTSSYGYLVSKRRLARQAVIAHDMLQRWLLLTPCWVQGLALARWAGSVIVETPGEKLWSRGDVLEWDSGNLPSRFRMGQIDRIRLRVTTEMTLPTASDFGAGQQVADLAQRPATRNGGQSTRTQRWQARQAGRDWRAGVCCE